MKTIAKFTIILAFIIGFVYLLNAGFKKQEIVDCYHLVGQSEEFANFYITNWQKEMCDAHGISINAEVK